MSGKYACAHEALYELPSSSIHCEQSRVHAERVPRDAFFYSNLVAIMTGRMSICQPVNELYQYVMPWQGGRARKHAAPEGSILQVDRLFDGQKH